MSKTAIQTPSAPAAIGPYSQAVFAPEGRTLYLSGQIAIDPATGAVETGDAAAQTHRVMDNLEAVLVAAGGDLDALLRTTIFLTDLSDFQAVNAAYASHFPAGSVPPARATVEVSALPKGVAVEISGVAVIPLAG